MYYLIHLSFLINSNRLVMKNSSSLYTILVWTFFLLTSGMSAQKPVVSDWMVNVSEGNGAPEISAIDFAPEIAVSGNMVYAVWISELPQGRRLSYRNSTDGGNTWGQIQEIAESSGFDYDRVQTRMYVYGNTVHIAYVVNDGGDRLMYLRSVDGGATFESVRELYFVPQGLEYLKVKGEGGR